MQTHLLTIGDEILIGQIVDTNSAWMAQQLNLKGIAVQGITTCGDQHADILQALNVAFQQADLVLTTGGLGPTKDDITKKALADFFGLSLEFHQPTYDRLVRIFEKLKLKTSESHRLQCLLPSGAEVLPNDMGTAPAMWIEQNGKVLVSMPGVPYEMKHLMEARVLPLIEQRFRTRPFQHRTLLTAGIAESLLADKIEDLEDAWAKEGIKLAYLPSLGRVRLRLTASEDDAAALSQRLDSRLALLRDRLDRLVYGTENQTLEGVVGEMLRQRNATVATAESCTGGLIAHQITTVSGASDYFRGSVVAYSNDVKIKVLKVSPLTIEQHGAVSEETVTEMAKGVLGVMNADYGIAVSGIAGPTGGTPDKPVGTIWVAVANRKAVKAVKLQLFKDRMKNVEYTTVFALNLLRLHLLQ